MAMISFWLAATALIVFALLFIVPPLVRVTPYGISRDRNEATISIHRKRLAELEMDFQRELISDENYEQSVGELKRAVINETSLGQQDMSLKEPSIRTRRVIAGIVSVVLPVMAIGLYLLLGNPAALLQQANASPPDHLATPEQISAMIQRLARRMQQKPDDAEGWAMLGRSYNVVGRHNDAIVAYEKAIQLRPKDAQLHADYADALATTQAGKLEGKPLMQIEAALKIDPNNQKALDLAGTAAFNRRDFQSAAKYWTQLEKLLPADSEGAQSVRGSIAEAKAAMNEKIVVAPSEGTKAGQLTLSGSVELSSALAEKLTPEHTLFIFARAVNGPRMPLAILRMKGIFLPHKFKLDDSLAMTPKMKLSSFQEVVVGARLSKSGDATPQSGDLQGMTGPVKVGSGGLKIVIDQLVP